MAELDRHPPGLTVTGSLSRVAGRMDAVAAAYDAHHAELYGYAASLVRDSAAAEDVMHEAFARLVRDSARGHWPDEPRAWLYRVCTNLAINRSRRRAAAERWHHLVGRVGASDDDEGEAAEETVIRRERHVELERALRTLPAEYRAALLLAAEGFSGREIAATLGRSEGAARNLLWRARLALKDQLEPDEPAGRAGDRR
jgi:RNA polymerase sigma-70 factor (ECF subfamily)